MQEYLPIIIIVAIIGTFSLIFIAAYAALKKHNIVRTEERNMADGELIRRLVGYALPFWKDFLLVLVIMIFSVVYDVVSPKIIGNIEEMVKIDFVLNDLFKMVIVYASILVVCMICTYFQSIILQRTGQKILSRLRLDLFTHIESLSHNQLNNIPVGKLVTRVTNDTNAISMMFTNVLVTMVKNVMGTILKRGDGMFNGKNKALTFSYDDGTNKEILLLR